MSELPKDGTHRAKKTPGVKVTAFESGPNSQDPGALMVQIPVTLLDSDVAWSGFGVISLIAADGIATANQKKNLATLREIFPSFTATTPWGSGADEAGNLFDAADSDTESVFEIVGENSTYTPKKSEANPNPQSTPRYNVKFINILGGGAAFRPDPLDRNTAITRWGGKFGSQSVVAKPAAKPSAKSVAPAPKAATSGPPGRRSVGSSSTGAPRTATMDEVWKALEKKHNLTDENSQAWADAHFFPAQDKVKPDANGELSPQEWGKVADLLDV